MTKWYLDLTADDGSGVIGYTALLDLDGWRLRYGSVLEALADGSVRTDSSLRAWSSPTQDGDLWRWASPELGVQGAWQPLEGPLSAELLRTDEGSVSWDCVAPRARAQVSVGDRTYEGLGYVERLALSIAPWRLPLQTLRWGRALTPERSLVWIDWRSDTHNAQWAFENGQPLVGFTVDEDGLTDDQGSARARFTDRRELRHGAVGSTALKILGRAARDRLPASALLLDETKWLSRATVGDSHGRCIHEVVRWP